MPIMLKGTGLFPVFQVGKNNFSRMLANQPLADINFHLIAHVPAQVWSSLKCKNIKKLSSPVLKIFTVFLCHSL